MRISQLDLGTDKVLLGITIGMDDLMAGPWGFAILRPSTTARYSASLLVARPMLRARVSTWLLSPGSPLYSTAPIPAGPGLPRREAPSV